jgi:hypothetical protein
MFIVGGTLIVVGFVTWNLWRIRKSLQVEISQELGKLIALFSPHGRMVLAAQDGCCHWSPDQAPARTPVSQAAVRRRLATFLRPHRQTEGLGVDYNDYCSSRTTRPRTPSWPNLRRHVQGRPDPDRAHLGRPAVPVVASAAAVFHRVLFRFGPLQPRPGAEQGQVDGYVGAARAQRHQPPHASIL